MLWAKTAVILAVVPVLIYAYEYGPNPGSNGVPGEATCVQSGCHTGTVNSGSGSVAVTFPGGLTYTPGVKQHLVVTVTDSTARRWGFQAAARPSSNARTQAGAFAASDSFTQVMCASADLNAFSADGIPNGAACPASQPLQYIEHTLAGYNHTQPSPATYEFDWTPPSTDVGSVVIYVAGNAANGDLTQNGDHIYTRSFTLTSAAAGGSSPAISQGGVVNGASFASGITAGSWVTITGSNLSAGSRTWRSDEIVNGNLPTQLDGVSVMIDNQPAAVYYISPTQVNVQAPSDSSLGPVNVVVTSNGSASNTATAQLQQYSPAFFLWNGKYAVATRPDFTYVGPPGLFQGLTTVPAQPGDAIILWGTGFGATNPDVPSGKTVPVNQAPAVTGNLTVTVGGVNAPVLGAVLSPGFAGLYQVAIQVPTTVPNGELPVVATLGGVPSPTGVVLAVQK